MKLYYVESKIEHNQSNTQPIKHKRKGVMNVINRGQARGQTQVKGKELDKETIDKINALSDGGKLAIVLCANAFRFGGNWAYLKSDSENYRDHLELLREEKENIVFSQVSNGALVVVNENFLAFNINQVVPNAINGTFVEMANQRRQEEKEKFQRFIDSVAKGKSRHVKKEKGYYEVTLGIYSVNDTNSIRINGNDYPAYKLTLIEAMEFAHQMTRQGRKVYARAISKEGQEVYDEVFKLASNSKGVGALYRGLEIADSGTGLFLNLRIV